MVIDFGKVFVNFEGQGLIDHDGEGKVVSMTLGRTAANALLVPNDKDNGADKIRKYDLALRVYGGGEVDLATEEVTAIRDAILKSYGPMICGQAAKMLS